MSRAWLIVALLACRAVAQEPLTREQSEAMKKAYFAMKAENEALKKQLGPLREQAQAARREHRDALDRQHQSLLESADLDIVRAGLQLMTDAQQRQHAARPYSPAIQRAVVELIDSPDPATAKLAAQVLAAYSPTEAIRNGFQPGDGPWRPVDHDGRSMFRQYGNFYQSKVDARGEFTAAELSDVLDLFTCKITLNKDVRPEEPISCKRESASLLEFVEQTLEPRGLTIRINAEGGELLRTEDPRAAVLRAYNVRGLLSGETTRDKALQQVKQAVEAQTDVLPGSRHTILVRGRETQQRKASIALAELRPKN